VSPPNPCRSCGTALQHCLEMRDETATYCCRSCLAQISLHAGSPPETEQARRARHLTPGAHRTTAPPVLWEYAVRNPQGEIFPMPSRAVALQIVRLQLFAGDDLEAVSRPVPPWEVLH
jgi:hypothetical protein